MVYKHGNLICPIIGKQSYDYLFKEDYDRYNARKGDDEAPAEGQ